VLAPIITGLLGKARPLPVPFRGRDEGKVAYPSIVCLVLEEGVANTPSLSAWHALFGFCWASVVWALASCCVAGRAAC
jgi:hypothetical protein